MVPKEKDSKHKDDKKASKDKEKEKGKPARACNQCYDAVFQPRIGASLATAPGASSSTNPYQTGGQSVAISMPSLALTTTLEEADEVSALGHGHGQEGSTASARSSGFRRSVSYAPGAYGSTSQLFGGSTSNLLMNVGSTSNLVYLGSANASASSVNLLSDGANAAGGAANRRSKALAASRRMSMPIVGLHAATVTTHTGERRCACLLCTMAG